MDYLYTLLPGVKRENENLLLLLKRDITVSDVDFGIITQLLAVVIIFILYWMDCKKEKALPLSVMEVGYGQLIHNDSTTSENGSMPGAEDGTVAGTGIGSFYSSSRGQLLITYRSSLLVTPVP